jgi:hypothetical protein
LAGMILGTILDQDQLSRRLLQQAFQENLVTLTVETIL